MENYALLLGKAFKLLRFGITIVHIQKAIHCLIILGLLSMPVIII